MSVLLVIVKAKAGIFIIVYNGLTFKELKKRLTLETTTQQRSNLFEVCKDKPFWIWDIEEHKKEDIKTKGNCCFNHIIGFQPKDKLKSRYLIIKRYYLIL
jgi:hypothetical protein